ncbi:MAG: hypothetical protein D6798_06130 [Deltaproteobacteria bacterium]|nr:MAG: hypothetical protein D6798_06130 [Deltaproteobacteria bacterium]
MMRRLTRSHVPMAVAVVCVAGCGTPGLTTTADPSYYDPEPGSLHLDPSGLYNFGRLSPFGDAAMGEVRVYAEGDEPVELADLYLDDSTSLAFEIVSDIRLPLVLQPGDDAIVKLSFAPYAVGEYFGRFVVVGVNDHDERSLDLELSGRGCEDLDEDARCDP